jgi:hypothetical protein
VAYFIDLFDATITEVWQEDGRQTILSDPFGERLAPHDSSRLVAAGRKEIKFVASYPPA